LIIDRHDAGLFQGDEELGESVRVFGRDNAIVLGIVRDEDGAELMGLSTAVPLFQARQKSVYPRGMERKVEVRL
jgi:hypothetical protein